MRISRDIPIFYDFYKSCFLSITAQSVNEISSIVDVTVSEESEPAINNGFPFKYFITHSTTGLRDEQISLNFFKHETWRVVVEIFQCIQINNPF